MDDKANRDGLLTIRVPTEIKARIEEAARERGQSMSTFVIGAAMKAAGRKPEESRGACPTFFRALCREAGHGGTRGYFQVGRQLVKTIYRMAPLVTKDDEWSAKLEELETLVEDGKDKEAIAWLRTYVPRCLALVPPRRRTSLLDGMREEINKYGMVKP